MTYFSNFLCFCCSSRCFLTEISEVCCDLLFLFLESQDFEGQTELLDIIENRVKNITFAFV